MDGEKNKDRAVTLGLHPYGIHLGAQVAPQRCPILRMSIEMLLMEICFSKKKSDILPLKQSVKSEMSPEL
ncbi:hypothetical protein [Desulfosediminicola flagellatus]|uniref:hypothetical protein n=1 Tax=Desulfosediminicola flagellatus TaxID=2569541 RepID=UPI0010AD0A7C|nr:hypothetical protein [Desulfosediminicola flagellatus]